ncbi:MAG: hypothetical protein O2958_11020 [Gemmatimonadetes bacterium]|nr:hypothetical protein [Gemmatimonadota bacterium]MDA1103704.1 hypothetical protein [Gemmatimonadota bacterium]
MRFAYIDSNGNEVPIPSVDALALRIELGAISEKTELYDAQADQWGPADTHEIFRTLSRAAGGSEGFVAPPPIAPLPVAPPSAARPPAMEPEPSEPEVALEPEVAAVEPAGALDGGGDFGLTLAESSEPSSEGDGLPPEEASGDDFGFGGLDLAPVSDKATDGAGVKPLDLSATVPKPKIVDEHDGPGGDFDFGDMHGGLELEGADEPSPDFGGGMELETTMDFSAGGFDAGGGGALELETPMSDFSPGSPPSWMEQDGPETGPEDVLDFSAVGSESSSDGASGDGSLRDRRTPRNKPSKPKHRRERALAGPIVGAVVVLAIGVGGYVGWPLLSARLASSGESEIPRVFIPELAEELMPQMRRVSDAAFAAAFADVRREWAASDPVTAPPPDWLAGVYLANASRFDNVPAFWDGVGDYLDRVRAIGLAEFDAAYAAQLQVAGVTGPDAASMRERADSGFVAAAADRVATFDRVEVLVEAALDLHDFLTANEDNIAYVPASSVTIDPVLEANPSTPEIRRAMLDLIDEVTGALARLQYLDVVTSEGLWGTVLGQIQENGVR